MSGFESFDSFDSFDASNLSESFVWLESIGSFASSTGCFSRLSYHCSVLPIKKAHEPQKVASADSYSAPLLVENPKAPESWSLLRQQSILKNHTYTR